MALVALLAVAVMVFAYVLTSRLNAASRFVGIDREHNAMVLARAKRALIGYMAHEAAIGDNPGTTTVVEGRNPGSLPCPEAPAHFGDPAQEGIAAGNCTLPAVGRLPWRTLGLDRLVDAAGEPLWYAVSLGWALPSAGATLTLNSDSIGQLSVDGVANDAVALIIAPGPAMTVLAGGACSAWSQSRPTAGPPDLRNYLECVNATSPPDATFVTSTPGSTFNDQVLRVTAADLIPPLEAAVADRMQREIAPAMRGVYGSAQWGTASTNPLYPFAAPFSNPGTADYRGADGNYQGLLPFTCTAAGCATGARLAPTFVTWNTGTGPTVTASGGAIVSSSCSFPTPSTARCSGVVAGVGTVTLRMAVRANNVAMALRTLAPANMTVEHGLLGYGPPGPGTSASATLNDDGSANLTLNGQVPGLVLGVNLLFRLTADLSVIADHALLDPDDPTTGWFVRNEWYRLVYYKAAQQSTADGLSMAGGLGCTSSNCLRFNVSGTRNIRAVLVLAGRSLSNPAGRPNGTLSDYVEYQNCDFSVSLSDCDPQTLFEQRPMRASKIAVSAINAPFNDRVILVDWGSALQVPAQVVTTAPLRIATLP